MKKKAARFKRTYDNMDSTMQGGLLLTFNTIREEMELEPVMNAVNF